MYYAKSSSLFNVLRKILNISVSSSAPNVLFTRATTDSSFHYDRSWNWLICKYFFRNFRSECRKVHSIHVWSVISIFWPRSKLVSPKLPILNGTHRNSQFSRWTTAPRSNEGGRWVFVRLVRKLWARELRLSINSDTNAFADTRHQQDLRERNNFLLRSTRVRRSPPHGRNSLWPRVNGYRTRRM